MNNRKKIATGLAGLLLITGAGLAGTMANWRTAESAPIGTINTGNLGVTVGVDGWTVDGRTYSSLNEITFVPGLEASTRIQGNVIVDGLSIDDIRIVSSELGDLETNEYGYIIRPNGTPSQLQVRLEESTGPDANGAYSVPLTVRFERSETPGMYDNATNFNLGHVTITVEQR